MKKLRKKAKVLDTKRNVLKETFGTFKFSKPIDQILKESNQECWDE